MNRIDDTTIEAVLEHLIADGAGGIGPALRRRRVPAGVTA
jgi:hypothetical protein